MRKITDHYQVACASASYAETNHFFEQTVVLSHALKPLIDYQIAQDGNTDCFVYFGSLHQRGPFSKMFRDVEIRGVHSPFYGAVLSTSGHAIGREGDENKWHPYKNKAFWAGAMDAGRYFYLLTDIEFYLGKGKKGPNPSSGTCREILWLLENGYTACPDPLFPRSTIFFPRPNESDRGIFSVLRMDPLHHASDVQNLLQCIQSVLLARLNLESILQLGLNFDRHVQSPLLNVMRVSLSSNTAALFSQDVEKKSRGIDQDAREVVTVEC